MDMIAKTILLILYLGLLLAGVILSWSPIGTWFVKKANSIVCE